MWECCHLCIIAQCIVRYIYLTSVYDRPDCRVRFICISPCRNKSTRDVSCSPPVFSEVRVIRSLVLFVCFVDRCLSFFFWQLCFLFFFDIRILIAPSVSSNSSCPQYCVSGYEEAIVDEMREKNDKKSVIIPKR